jgi:hypothetical protein
MAWLMCMCCVCVFIYLYLYLFYSVRFFVQILRANRQTSKCVYVCEKEKKEKVNARDSSKFFSTGPGLLIIVRIVVRG